MKSVNSQESNKYSFNITSEANEIVNNEYTIIKLPNYVNSFSTEFTIQISPIYNGKINLYSTSTIENNKFKVYGENGSFFWIVHGKRLNIVVEPDKDNIIINGNGPYTWI